MADCNHKTFGPLRYPLLLKTFQTRSKCSLLSNMLITLLNLVFLFLYLGRDYYLFIHNNSLVDSFKCI